MESKAIEYLLSKDFKAHGRIIKKHSKDIHCVRETDAPPKMVITAVHANVEYAFCLVL